MSENYQQVFSRMNRTYWRCQGEGGGIQVNSQLYPDLGYGEIVQYASMIVQAPQVLIRVEKVPQGARVRIKLANIGAQGFMADGFARWAEGDTRCAPWRQPSSSDT
ncbi:hypothetical protein [Frigidibacter oleivorans]|uniref:hypothetical protein n=1 Tax=Frigidibacter oleivorans TaxID=2487129 RepID=UPI0013E081CE|nr:hypothetical protein [Frigidibacter oleivorans]